MSFKDFTCYAKPKLYISEFTSAAFPFYCQYPERNVRREPNKVSLLTKVLYCVADNVENRLYMYVDSKIEYNRYRGRIICLLVYYCL